MRDDANAVIVAPQDLAAAQAGRQQEFEVTDSFCVYPFMSLNIMPAGTAKPCCAFGTLLEDAGKPLSVYDSSMGAIWNSQAMRDIRRAMVEGKPVAACEYCYNQERLGLASMWTDDTGRWSRGLFDFPNHSGATAANLKAQARDNGFALPGGPAWLDLDMGNLCNLKCRMCNSTYSSAIAADPVHARWSPPSPEPGRWRRDSLAIAPQRILGVSYAGIGYPVAEGAGQTAWLEETALVGMERRPAGAASLSVRISQDKPDRQPLRLAVDGHVLFDGPLPAGAWERTFDLPEAIAGAMEISIASPAFFNKTLGHDTGPGLQEMKIARALPGSNSLALSRLGGTGQWYKDVEFLASELFANPDRLEKIRFIGGEPLLIKEVRQSLAYLIEKGIADRITLMIVTNGSVCDDEILDMLNKFKSVILLFSVDGYGKTNDYIRFPSNWSDVENNIKSLSSLPKASPRINMTIQIYNLFDIPNLIEFCANAGVEFGYHLLQWPYYLSSMTLPLSLRLPVAARLREIALRNDLRSIIEVEKRFDFRKTIGQLANALSAPVDFSPARLHEFMQFTNDLDRSRGQNWRQSLPGLARAFAAAGIVWDDDARHAA